MVRNAVLLGAVMTGSMVVGLANGFSVVRTGLAHRSRLLRLHAEPQEAPKQQRERTNPNQEEKEQQEEENPAPATTTTTRKMKVNKYYQEGCGLGLSDDWDFLMEEEKKKKRVPLEDLQPHIDLAGRAARRMEKDGQPERKLTKEEEWEIDMVDFIDHYGLVYERKPGDPHHYPIPGKPPREISPQDREAHEINMMIRCGESPTDTIRPLPPVTEQQIHNVSQLVVQNDTTMAMESTKFLDEAVASTFAQHAKPNGKTHQQRPVMDAHAVAAWMTKGHGYKVTPNDRSVLTVLSRYGTYGTGHLTQDQLHQFYLSQITAALDGTARKQQRYWKIEQMTIPQVFQFIRNHDIVTPFEFQRSILEREHEKKIMAPPKQIAMESFMDECELLEIHNQQLPLGIESRRKGHKSMSHTMVKLGSDGKTPVEQKDGTFVYVDEDLCTGCSECAGLAPISFRMLEDTGRARAIKQMDDLLVDSAVASCPARCMMRVSFEELQELELTRTKSEEEPDPYRRRQPVPLHVKGMESDRNRESSIYQNVKLKCNLSKACPQKGCYQCPSYDNPGDNPYYKKKQQRAIHVRAEALIESGKVDGIAKYADL